MPMGNPLLYRLMMKNPVSGDPASQDLEKEASALSSLLGSGFGKPKEGNIGLPTSPETKRVSAVERLLKDEEDKLNEEIKKEGTVPKKLLMALAMGLSAYAGDRGAPVFQMLAEKQSATKLRKEMLRNVKIRQAERQEEADTRSQERKEEYGYRREEAEAGRGFQADQATIDRRIRLFEIGTEVSQQEKGRNLQLVITDKKIRADKDALDQQLAASLKELKIREGGLNSRQASDNNLRNKDLNLRAQGMRMQIAGEIAQKISPFAAQMNPGDIYDFANQIADGMMNGRSVTEAIKGVDPSLKSVFHAANSFTMAVNEAELKKILTSSYNDYLGTIRNPVTGQIPSDAPTLEEFASYANGTKISFFGGDEAPEGGVDPKGAKGYNWGSFSSSEAAETYKSWQEQYEGSLSDFYTWSKKHGSSDFSKEAKKAIEYVDNEMNRKGSGIFDAFSPLLHPGLPIIKKLSDRED
jgi:hypothetical protein